MYTIAHLSDPHLDMPNQVALCRLLNKRIFGYLSWHMNRKNIFSRKIVDIMTEDINKQAPDHIVVTGDLTNISLKEEFINAANWLKHFTKTENISVIPGNHDKYVPINWNESLGLWSNYMQSQTTSNLQFIKPKSQLDNNHFPYMKEIGDIAIIGVSSAIVTPPLIAAGRVSKIQLNILSEYLRQLGKLKKYRIILIHHPPLKGQNRWRKALWNANDFTKVVYDYGAELILHGHNHRDMETTIKTKNGKKVNIIGVPAACAQVADGKPAAAYNLYHINHNGTNWDFTITTRKLNIKKQIFTN